MGCGCSTNASIVLDDRKPRRHRHGQAPDNHFTPDQRALQYVVPDHPDNASGDRRRGLGAEGRNHHSGALDAPVSCRERERERLRGEGEGEGDREEDGDASPSSPPPIGIILPSGHILVGSPDSLTSEDLPDRLCRALSASPPPRQDEHDAIRQLDALVYEANGVATDAEDEEPVDDDLDVEPAAGYGLVQWDTGGSGTELNDLPLLSRKEIMAHNSEPRDSDFDFWAPFKGLVYDASHVYRILESDVQQIITSSAMRRAHKESFERRRLYPLVFHYLPWLGLSLQGVEPKLAAPDLVVGRMRTDGWQDHDCKVKAGVQDATAVAMLIRDVKASTSRRGHKDFLGVLTRCSFTCGRTRTPSPGDPDHIPFPLSVKPRTLRPWITKWRPFDFTLPVPDEPPMCYLTNGDDPDNDVTGGLRPWLSDGQLFDHVIDGEIAWRVLPNDVIANDVMTSRQEKVARSRLARRHLNDTLRMTQRRQILGHYFVEKYRYVDEIKIEQFLGWADIMTKHWEEFMELCGSPTS